MADTAMLHADVAGYLLGMLDDGEVAAVESHLGACAVCRAEYDDLADLPALLDLAASTEPLPSVAGEPPATAGVVVDLAASRSQATRRFGQWLAAAAAAAAIIAGVVVIARGGEDGSATFTLAAEPGIEASGTVEISDLANGTGVRLRLAGVQPTADGERLECWWVDADGVRVSAGSFLVDQSGEVDVQLTTATPRTPGWRLNVNRVTADGEQTTILSVASR